MFLFDTLGDNSSGGGQSVPPSAHMVLTDLMEIVIRHSLPIGKCENALAQLPNRVLHRGEQEMIRLWRTENDKIRMLAEIADEIREPWKVLSNDAMLKATREVRQLIEEVCGFRRWQAQMLRKRLRSWRDDPEDVRVNVRIARSDIKSFRRVIGQLEVPRYPLAVLIEEDRFQAQPLAERGTGTDGAESECESKRRSAEVSGTTNQADDGWLEALRSVEIGGAFTSEVCTPHYAIGQGLGKCVGLLRRGLFEKSVTAFVAAEKASVSEKIRNEVNTLWLDGCKTIRQIAEVALFDIEDPLNGPTTDVVS